MKTKRKGLFCLVILLTGAIYVAVQAQQKKDTHRPDFSGGWKSKESISMGGNIVCCYDSGDRMLATTMKIAAHADFLTIDVASSFPGTAPVTSQEKLTFDGKESRINHDPERGKKFTVRLSADRQTMTVNSIVHLTVPTASDTTVRKQMIVYVTEVWNLSKDGKSITVQTTAKSDVYGEVCSWKTVFDKVN
jgi:hypothetical protein